MKIIDKAVFGATKIASKANQPLKTVGSAAVGAVKATGSAAVGAVKATGSAAVGAVKATGSAGKDAVLYAVEKANNFASKRIAEPIQNFNTFIETYNKKQDNLQKVKNVGNLDEANEGNKALIARKKEKALELIPDTAFPVESSLGKDKKISQRELRADEAMVVNLFAYLKANKDNNPQNYLNKNFNRHALHHLYNVMDNATTKKPHEKQYDGMHLGAFHAVFDIKNSNDLDSEAVKKVASLIHGAYEEKRKNKKSTLELEDTVTKYFEAQAQAQAQAQAATTIQTAFRESKARKTLAHTTKEATSETTNEGVIGSMKTNKNNDLDRTEHTRNVTRTKSAPLLRSRFSSGKNQDTQLDRPLRTLSRTISMPLNSIREEDTSGQNDMPLTLPKR